MNLTTFTYSFMDRFESYGEQQILQQVALGDEEAFAIVFGHYRPRIYSVALYYLKSTESAEETVQDVFLKIWVKRSELPSIQKFNAYLFIVARNIILDRLKKTAYENAAKREMSFNPGYTADTDDRIKQWQYDRLLDEAVSRLPPRQKQIFLLVKQEGKDHKEVAEELGLSKLTIKKQMARALKSVRQYLDKFLAILI